MEFNKKKLALLKEALQYGVANGKTEAETAEFSFLLLDVEHALVQEDVQKPKPKEENDLKGFFMDKLMGAAKASERGTFARNAMMAMIKASYPECMNNKEKLVQDSFELADAFIGGVIGE
jgi:hypothetical protein